MKHRNRIDGLLTMRKVGQLLNVDTITLRQWASDGVIKSYRAGSHGVYKFKAKDVAIFLLEEGKGFQLNLNLLMRKKIESTKITDSLNPCSISSRSLINEDSNKRKVRQ